MQEEELLSTFQVHHTVTTDTRQLQRGSLFFALRGERFNGNSFALQALEAGCSAVVVDEDVASDDPRIVRVKDALKALQELAKAYRRTCSIPILAITGSNGKTTTKELIREVLAKKYKVFATAGNLNNHIGVPLSLLSIPEECELAIIEMGANHRGEIRDLCAIAEPTFGLITNIGKAHLEGFGGEEGVKLGKKELFDFIAEHDGKVFVHSDQPVLMEISVGMNRILFAQHSDRFNLELLGEQPVLSFRFTTGAYDSGTRKTNLAGAYNMDNMAAAACIGLYFQVDPADIAHALADYSPDNSRSQLVHTKRNTLILDAYNANPSSLLHALQNLNRQDHPNRYFIIGDMLELGEASEREHRSILQTAVEFGLTGIVVGPQFHELAADFGIRSFSTRLEALAYLQSVVISDALILVKGSRGMRLEELVPAL